MRVNENWLREWVNPAINMRQLADTLTMAGLEVDSVEPVAPFFSGVVVAKVVEVAPHPDAKKLHICNIDDGSGELFSVICGADNVCEGLVVAFAKVGAILPGNLKIEAKTLRGTKSFGMLCSASELGLAESSQGILELTEEYELGVNVYECLALDDTVIDIDLTPNRSDCLSVQGIAREVSGLLNTALEKTTAVAAIDGSSKTTFPVSIEAPKDCLRYVGRVIEGVSGAMRSPMWMQEKLRRAGIRSSNAIIDVVNFVMLEMGQPMHAFDLDKLDTGIVVRFANSSETLELLDGRVVELSTDDLVIADTKNPIALAGIMGGIHTAVDSQTTNIFLESASFKPEAIMGKARSYGLHTDSSHRFERGVDPELASQAIERATQLMLDLVNGDAGPVVICEEGYSVLSQSRQIELEHEKVEALLGIKISIKKVQELLRRLHCDVHIKAGGLRVVPPSFRFDLTMDVDLVEEVARLVGYENIPGKIKALSLDNNSSATSANELNLMKQALVSCGYHEIISFSFVDQTIESLLNPKHAAKALTNPISQELSVMRSSIWPGLIKAAQYNLHRQQTCIRLFECGLQFIQTETGLTQPRILSGLISESCQPEQWGVKPRKVDFYDIKGDVECLLEIVTQADTQPLFEFLLDPALHPGQAAKIILDGKEIGRLGKLHPRIQSALDIDQPFFLFELQLNKLLQKTPEVVFQPLSKYPSIRRDITLIVNKSINAKEICSNIEQMKITFLQKIKIFSVYTGKEIPESKKSISLGLILQEYSRTLTDKEIEQTISLIISQLENKVGAKIKS